MNTKRSTWIVITEETQYLQVSFLVMLMLQVLDIEVLVQQMSFDGLAKDHLPSPKHAAPASVRLQVLSVDYALLELVTVAEPSNALKVDSKPMV